MSQTPGPVGRARLSCLPCRKRKSKCDEAQPCSSCVLRGTTSQCSLPATNSPSASADAMRDADAVRAAAAAGLRVLSGGGPSDGPPAAPTSTPTQVARKKRQRVDESTVQAAPPPSTPLGEVALIKDSLARLDVMLQSQQTSQALSMLQSSILGGDNSLAQFMEPMPPRDDDLMKRLVALLPSRFDCEVLLEFLLQEADWLVNYLSPDMVLSIWSRTVYGGRISLAESGTLCALLTMSAMLLSESPHRNYKTHESPSTLHAALFQYSLDIMDSPALKLPTWEKVVMLTCMAEVLKIGGQRSLAYWTTVNQQATDVCVEYGLFDESSDVWATMDVEKTELARRLAHVGVQREHWISIHSERATRFSAKDVRVEPAVYDNLGLSKPFVASPDGLSKADETIFKTHTKPIPRLFRHKAPGEAQKSAHFAAMSIQESTLIPEISSYLQSVASWTTIAESTPHRGSDDQREELLHICTALRERIMQFKLWLDSDLAEPKVLRADDMFQCRHAAQATLIHHGLRHMLACCYRPWMANDITTEDPSPLLIETQLHALDLARATVATIPTTRILLTCGVVPFFASWCAANLYVAATTLAIPLLLSSKRTFPDFEGNDPCPKQTAAAWPQRNSSAVSPASTEDSRRSSLLAIHGRAGSPSAPAETHMMAVPPSELRHLASDILYVLDTLSMISSTSPEASPMSKAAKERLSLLVDHYDIRQHSRGEGVHDRSLLPGANSSPATTEEDMQTDPSNAAALLGFSGGGTNATFSANATTVDLGVTAAPTVPLSQGVAGGSQFAPTPNPAMPIFDSTGRNQNLFDSILALDDTFWNDLLQSGAGAVQANGAGTSNGKRG